MVFMKPKNHQKDIDVTKIMYYSNPPYTFSPLDVKVTRLKTQRFTARDIGRLKDPC